MSDRSRCKRDGREAFCPGADPMDCHPYKRKSWEFDFKFEAFCEGWNEAEATYLALEEEEEEMDDRLRICPWHCDGECLGNYHHKHYGNCSEDDCPILYWKGL